MLCYKVRSALPQVWRWERGVSKIPFFNKLSQMEGGCAVWGRPNEVCRMFIPAVPSLPAVGPSDLLCLFFPELIKQELPVCFNSKANKRCCCSTHITEGLVFPEGFFLSQPCVQSCFLTRSEDKSLYQTTGCSSVRVYDVWQSVTCTERNYPLHFLYIYTLYL